MLPWKEAVSINIRYCNNVKAINDYIHLITHNNSERSAAVFETKLNRKSEIDFDRLESTKILKERNQN